MPALENKTLSLCITFWNKPCLRIPGTTASFSCQPLDMTFLAHAMGSEGNKLVFIVGMVRRFPIQLAVIVGHHAMIATGPLGGKTVETGLVIASRDCVAADCIGARLLGFEPQGVRHLFEAGRLSLGETHTKRMHIKGISLTEAVHALTKAAYGEPLKFMHA